MKLHSRLWLGHCQWVLKTDSHWTWTFNEINILRRGGGGNVVFGNTIFSMSPEVNALVLSHLRLLIRNAICSSFFPYMLEDRMANEENMSSDNVYTSRRNIVLKFYFVKTLISLTLRDDFMRILQCPCLPLG